uniref:FAST kinase domains 3 n=1 Tax=Hucho hucho TaxID=62062 RepID=A0A4W5NRJ4_9TELE
MALKVIKRLQLLRQTRAHFSPPGGLGCISRLLCGPVGEPLCVAYRCIQRQSASLYEFVHHCQGLFLRHWVKEKAFLDRLGSCSSSRQVLHSSALQISVGQLCTLGQAQLALAGPGCGILEQVMEQVQRQEPSQWSPAELTAVYGLLQAGVGEEGSYQDLLNAIHVLKMSFTSHPETVTKVMQYFGRRNILSLPVFDAVAESFVYRADDYSTSQVARQIIPFGKLGYLPPNAGEVFQKVEAILYAHFSNFQPRILLNLLHSCVLVERFPVNFVSKVFNLYFLQKLQEQVMGVDRIVLAQLTQLYIAVKLECPFYEGPKLLSMYCVKFFLTPGQSLETTFDGHLYNYVKTGLVDLLGTRAYFTSRVLTPYCYPLDVEIKLDEDGYVLPASEIDDIFKRISVCIDGHKRFTVNTRQLLGKEAIKQRHLRLLGYEVVRNIPYYEFSRTRPRLLNIFPLSYRLSW